MKWAKVELVNPLGDVTVVTCLRTNNTDLCLEGGRGRSTERGPSLFFPFDSSQSSTILSTVSLNLPTLLDFSFVEIYSGHGSARVNLCASGTWSVTCFLCGGGKEQTEFSKESTEVCNFIVFLVKYVGDAFFSKGLVINYGDF